MSYISLYRKYRPNRFMDVVGQPHVIGSALGAIRQGKISHAYLFAGPRGTGKTSVARLFVRAINCENPNDFEPCNECKTCKDFLEGRSLDLLEIDAASNRGIDEIRSLREKVQFAATGAKYKAFIIDEVHMLTKEAFNALLKTLEEPPKNTVFILATTEIHKLPETIISRCQRFDFRRIADTEIIELLKKVLVAEKIEFEEEAIRLIARAASGGMRDALSLTDQLASVGDTLTLERTLGFLGNVSEEMVNKILIGMAEKDGKKLLEILDGLSEKGVHWPNLASQIISGIRQVIMEYFGQNQKSLYLISKENVVELTKAQNVAFWTSAIESFIQVENELKNSPVPMLSFELAILKICNSGSAVTSNKEFETTEVVKKSENQTKKLDDSKIAEDFQMHWGEIQIKAKKVSAALYSLLHPAVFSGYENGKIVLSFPTKFHADRLNDGKNILVAEKIISEVLNSEVGLKCVAQEVKKEDDILDVAKEIFAE